MRPEPINWRELALRLLGLSIGVAVADALARGIAADSLSTLLAVAVVLGLLNAFLRPLLVLFALPFVVMTLGLGLWLINAALLKLAGAVVPGFTVASWGSALWGAFLMSLCGLIGKLVVNPPRVQVQGYGRASTPSPARPEGPSASPESPSEGVRRIGRVSPRRAQDDDIIAV